MLFNLMMISSLYNPMTAATRTIISCCGDSERHSSPHPSRITQYSLTFTVFGRLQVADIGSEFYGNLRKPSEDLYNSSICLEDFPFFDPKVLKKSLK